MNGDLGQAQVFVKADNKVRMIEFTVLDDGWNYPTNKNNSQVMASSLHHLDSEWVLNIGLAANDDLESQTVQEMYDSFVACESDESQ